MFGVSWMRQVYLIGTHHSYQLKLCEEFKKALINFCSKQNVKAIAEEANADALVEEGVNETITRQIADHLGLTHCYCDPDESIRAELGIQNEGIIKSQALFFEWSPEEKEARIQDEYRKREQVWLNGLNSINETPILFVCGANHVSAFCDLLNKSGYYCIIVSEDWTPNKRLHMDCS